MDYHDETIAAIATPFGVGGIGIIRISGCNAEHIAQKIFRSRRAIQSFESFRLYLGHIVDPKSQLPIDEVLLSVMRAPFSYTREDVVEINSHSGYTILSTILHIILQTGARLARPGEFTLRAFLNGRIDLTQAEAIIDLVNAKGDISLQLAANQLSGELKTRIEEIRRVLIEILAHIEASIDFPDEESIPINRTSMSNRIKKEILKPITEFIAAYKLRKVWHEGITVVIAGRVNVGKSSIFNRLLREEKAIVTPIPGTTRDILECMVYIEGMPVKLVDTAGMRKVKGKIEKKGVKLTKAQLATADVTLLVFDRSRPLNQHDRGLLQEVDRKTTIAVINKIDLPAKLSMKKVKSLCEGLTMVEISALTGEGFPGLSQAISDKFKHRTTDIYPQTIIPNVRHKMLLTETATCLKNAGSNLLKGLPLELVAADLSWARDCIDEITGNRTSEELLDSIFSNFCVGK